MLFQKGVADSGLWGSKFFGRIMLQESQIGDGCLHKVWRAKVIYGLEPVFESGNTCIIKARNHVAYGGKGDGSLVDRNLEIAMQVWWLLLIIRCVVPASHLAEHLFTVFTGMCRSAKFRTWLVNIAKYLLQKQDWLKTSAPLLSKYHYFEVKDNVLVQMDCLNSPLVIRIMAIFVSQGDSTLPCVPTCKCRALCHSGGRSYWALSEVLHAGSHRPGGSMHQLRCQTEVLCSAALDFPVD